jgi:hypothetical protein
VSVPRSPLTKGDRDNLARLARQRARVAKQPVVAGQRRAVISMADRRLLRCCWRLDDVSNRLVVLTGRLAAWATRRAMDREGDR